MPKRLDPKGSLKSASEKSNIRDKWEDNLCGSEYSILSSVKKRKRRVPCFLLLPLFRQMKLTETKLMQPKAENLHVPSSIRFNVLFLMMRSMTRSNSMSSHVDI